MGIHVDDMLVQMEAGLGPDAFRRFLFRYGGRTIGVRLHSRGDAVHEWLKDHVGYGRIPISRGPSNPRTRCRYTALVQLRAGLSIDQVARAVNVHTRTVSKWKTGFAECGLLAATA